MKIVHLQVYKTAVVSFEAPSKLNVEERFEMKMWLYTVPGKAPALYWEPDKSRVITITHGIST